MTFGSARRRRRRLTGTSLLLIFATIVIMVDATVVTITKANDASFGGTFIRAYYENLNAPVTGCALPCLTVDTQTAQPGASNSFTLTSGSNAYLWSPQFASAKAISAGAWTLDFWGAGFNYVPITITNSQGSATPNPLQVKITWNPSTYATYESASLGNVRFCSDLACNTVLNAWLESCTPSCSTSATSASAWAKLTSSIGANGGTLTVYMVFQLKTTNFDGNHWGEAPYLSGTYGQYDNGANVFTFYDNFAGTTLSAKWTQLVSATGATITVNDGLTVGTSTVNGYGFVISQNQVYPAVAETYTTSGNSILGVSTSQALNGFIAPYTGYSMDWYAGYDDVEFEGAGSAQLAAPTQPAFPAGIWQVTWSATGAEYFQDGGGVNYVGTDNSAGIANYGIYVGQSNGVIGSSVFSWARMRAYPPNNILPSASLGALTTNKVSVSAYVTNNAGTVVGTAATNVLSPAVGSSKAEYTMSFAGAQVTVPANGYVEVVIKASVDTCTLYWGAGQPTNFQVSFTYRSA